MVFAWLCHIVSIIIMELKLTIIKYQIYNCYNGNNLKWISCELHYFFHWCITSTNELQLKPIDLMNH